MGRGAATDPLIGAVISGRYEVLRKIAKGGMGTIYEVRSTRLGKSFALKALSAEAAEDPEVLVRFRREAEVVAKLTHPNIVEVVDWDSLADGSPFLVMEYLRGEALAIRVRKGGPLAWPKLAQVSDQVLAALTVAHRAGVVHRDLKPENIFLSIDDAGEERVKLLDFGISKLRDSKTFATTDARVLGTPAYMAPEQAEGRHDLIGPATDVWAIGAILYEMTTGRVAFDAPSTPAILYRVCHGEPDPIRELRPDAPPALVGLIGALLTRDAATRPSDVELVRGELRTALRSLDAVSWAEPLRMLTPPPGSLRLSAPMPVAGPRSAAVTATKPTRAETTGSARPTVFERARARAPRRGAFLAAALVAVAAAVVGVVVAIGTDDEPATERGAAAELAAVVAPALVPAPPDAAPAAAAAQPEPVPEPAFVKVKIKVSSTPPGAEVYRMPDAIKVGTTPWTTELPRQDGTAVFVLKKARYEDGRVEIDLTKGGSVRAKLQREERRRPGRRRGDPVDPFKGRN
jgi:serine/threonine-protein kinase